MRWRWARGNGPKPIARCRRRGIISSSIFAEGWVLGTSPRMTTVGLNCETFTLVDVFGGELIHPRWSGHILRSVRPRNQGAHMSSMCVVAAGVSSSVHALPRIGYHAISCPCGNPRVPGKSSERIGDMLARACQGCLRMAASAALALGTGANAFAGHDQPRVRRVRVGRPRSSGSKRQAASPHQTSGPEWRCRPAPDCDRSNLRAGTPRRQRPMRRDVESEGLTRRPLGKSGQMTDAGRNDPFLDGSTHV